MGTELEFKYALSGAGQWSRLADELGGRFGPWQEVKMETAYFDTQDRLLSGRQWTLRVRRENGVPVLTAKAPGPGRARGEWELPGGTLRDLHRLAEQGAPLDLTRLTPEQLRSQCGVRFRRLRCLAGLPGATAELALDEGVFTGGGRETPFWELEAELKGGSEDALAQWCRSLADAWGLLEEPRSKFLRAMALTEK